MFISEVSLDDLLNTTFARVLKKGTKTQPSRGRALELFGVMLELRNPLARTSRTVSKGTIFSCLGEFLWYMTGSQDLAFIEYYIKRYREEAGESGKLYGGYGPRLFAMHGRHNQISNVIKLLADSPDSRRAVIQIFDAKDISKRRKEIPCTCTIQFLRRYGKLHAITSMRSNDVFRGLQHDIFAFTMLQEFVARSLGLKLGTYKHSVASLHLYECDIQAVCDYLREGWQWDAPMPAMPDARPDPSVAATLQAEAAIRSGHSPVMTGIPYWDDLIRLLLIYAMYKKKDRAGIATVKKQMAHDVYLTYIERSQTKLQADPDLLTGLS